MDFVALLKDNNLKVTPQRLEIVKGLYTHRHMNIDDIYKFLKASFPSISLATVYKNVNAMMEIFFLSEVKIPHQKNVYELTKEKHSHIICSKCNSVMDIHLNIDNILDEAKKLSNYDLEECSVIISGLCTKCKN